MCELQLGCCVHVDVEEQASRAKGELGLGVQGASGPACFVEGAARAHPAAGAAALSCAALEHHLEDNVGASYDGCS